MKIETANIFKLTFTYEGAELMIPIAATTQAEAMAKVSTYMQGWLKEMGTKSTDSVLSPVQLNQEKITEPDPYALQLRIEELVQKLIPIKKPKGANTIEKLVKDWTGFPMEPMNYASIIAELGRLSTDGN